MIKNSELFIRDPANSELMNNGQARITSEDTVQERDTLREELSNFVCEGQYEDGMVRILESYLQHLSGTSQPAAWVSGFFGSGKSHLLKMLCHLWVDTEFPDGARARSLVKDLPEDVVAALKELDTEGRKAGGLHAVSGTLPARQIISADVGCCLVFADGLRYDLAQRLSLVLSERGLMVTLRQRWSALPSVTATAKPAVSPVTAKIRGVGLPDSFAPALAEDEDKSLTFARMHSLLKAEGYQVIGGDEVGDPAAAKARGWCEIGEIDKRGHSMQTKLASVVAEQVELIAERIAELLDAGWREVRVITDHGWLLMPGGLPKEDLPHYLTEAKWARCATIKGESKPNVPKAAWHWNQSAEFATGPGIRCFSAGHAYAHGGISLQECLIADMSVTLQNQPVRQDVSITKVDWKGLRCRITVEPASAGLIVDLRSKPNDPTTSVAASGKPLDGPRSDRGETVTLFVEDDDLEGTVVAVTVCNDAGQTIAKQNTTIGGDQ